MAQNAVAGGSAGDTGMGMGGMWVDLSASGFFCESKHPLAHPLAAQPLAAHQVGNDDGNS